MPTATYFKLKLEPGETDRFRKESEDRVGIENGFFFTHLRMAYIVEGDAEKKPVSFPKALGAVCKVYVHERGMRRIL